MQAAGAGEASPSDAEAGPLPAPDDQVVFEPAAQTKQRADEDEKGTPLEQFATLRSTGETVRLTRGFGADSHMGLGAHARRVRQLRRNQDANLAQRRR